MPSRECLDLLFWWIPMHLRDAGLQQTLIQSIQSVFLCNQAPVGCVTGFSFLVIRTWYHWTFLGPALEKFCTGGMRLQNLSAHCTKACWCLLTPGLPSAGIWAAQFWVDRYPCIGSTMALACMLMSRSACLAALAYDKQKRQNEREFLTCLHQASDWLVRPYGAMKAMKLMITTGPLTNSVVTIEMVMSLLQY